MFSRVVNIKLKPGKTEEAINLYRESIVPAAEQQQGFKGTYLLTDSDNDMGIAISLWESEEAMKAGETSGYYQEQVDKFSELFAESPTMAHYEVTVDVQK